MTFVGLSCLGEHLGSLFKMLNLFLCDSVGNNDGNDELVQKRKSLLSELESNLWSLMTARGQSEV